MDCLLFRLSTPSFIKALSFPLCQRGMKGISGFFASLVAWREKISGTLLSNILNGSFTDVGCDNQRRIQTFRDLTHRARLWDRPKPASSAAIRIGVPMPSTTGT